MDSAVGRGGRAGWLAWPVMARALRVSGMVRRFRVDVMRAVAPPALGAVRAPLAPHVPVAGVPGAMVVRQARADPPPPQPGAARRRGLGPVVPPALPQRAGPEALAGIGSVGRAAAAVQVARVVAGRRFIAVGHQMTVPGAPAAAGKSRRVELGYGAVVADHAARRESPVSGGGGTGWRLDRAAAGRSTAVDASGRRDGPVTRGVSAAAPHTRAGVAPQDAPDRVAAALEDRPAVRRRMFAGPGQAGLQVSSDALIRPGGGAAPVAKAGFAGAATGVTRAISAVRQLGARLPAGGAPAPKGLAAAPRGTSRIPQASGNPPVAGSMAADWPGSGAGSGPGAPQEAGGQAMGGMSIWTAR